jgi:hypothetical protein
MQPGRRICLLALLACLAVTAAAADEGKKDEPKRSRAAEDNETLREELARKDKEVAGLRKQIDALKAELAATKKKLDGKAGDRLWQQAQRDFDAQEYGKALAAVDELVALKRLDEARRQASYLGFVAAKLAAGALAQAAKSLAPGELRDSLSKEQASLEKRGDKRYFEASDGLADEEVRTRYQAWLEKLAQKMEKGAPAVMAATTWYYLGKYDAALKGYEKLLKDASSPAERCTLLGGMASCQGGLGEVQGLKKVFGEIRKELPKLDEETRRKWEDWLKEAESALGRQPQKQDLSDQ